jgi:hypothetical protein
MDYYLKAYNIYKISLTNTHSKYSHLYNTLAQIYEKRNMKDEA